MTAHLLSPTSANTVATLRRATITLRTTPISGAYTRTLSLTQAGAGSATLRLTVGGATFDPSTSSLAVGSASGDTTIVVEVSGDATGWRVDALSASFVSAMKRDNNLELSYFANVGVARSADVTIRTTGGAGTAATRSITLRQAGAPVSVSRSTYDTTAAAGSVSPTITIGGGAAGYEASASEAFVTFGSARTTTATASESGELIINYTANESAVSRTATITIRTTGEGAAAEATIMLTQAAGARAGAHTVSVSRSTYDTTAAAGSVSPTITIGGGAAGYEASASETFVSFGSARTTTATASESGELIINYTANESAASRTATITIRTTGEGEAAEATITLRQVASPRAGAHTVSVSRSTYDTTAAAGSVSPMITIGGGAAGYEASTSEAFVTFGSARTTTTTSSESGDLIINYTANESAVSRTATITIRTTGEGTPVSETITLTQGAMAASMGVISLDEGLVLYPNPVSGRLHINGLQERALVRISTLGGRILRRAPVSFSNSSIDVSNLHGGTYVVLIESSEAVLSKRLVIIE